MLRSLPAVEEVLEAPLLTDALADYGRELVVESVRTALERLRKRIMAGEDVAPAEAEPAGVADAAAVEARRVALPHLRPLINATGVVLHTNLGRAVMAPEAIEAVGEIASAYSNLEYDLEAGRRGSRHDHITRLIVALTGAGNALVVNNNAAAVLLALTVFGSGREVVVSRGELIEIGGSFRIPDIMASSSARMVEVGTTNKTKLSDYENAIGPDTAMLLHVHTSNYKVVGFTAEVDIGDLARLGHERGLIVAHDLGSGVLADMPVLADEPSVHQSLASGADIVTFSGDKLLGGPQAGIVVGKSEHIEKMKKHPMARAMRVDKMTLAALQATLAVYLKPEEAIRRIPTLRMLNESDGSLLTRAEKLAGQIRAVTPDLAEVDVEKAASKVGGGSLPLLEIESHVCAVTPFNITVDELAAKIRQADPPAIGRIHREKLLLDVRTILPGQGAALAVAIGEALGGPVTERPEEA
ncbi:MAG: L-seryl-tRNA(Sec) selenium transferase [Thermoleophilia bacterium]|nr:L-seryl-tRNA(Sec) selenium transferase [Thermoleophilia bacterium]